MKETIQKFIGDAIRQTLKSGSFPSGVLTVAPSNDCLMIISK
jgi:hypothetical protein